MFQLLAVLGLIVAINCFFIGFLISDATAHSKDEEQEPGNALSIGVFSFFQFILSSFGISDFAVGAAMYSKTKWVPVKRMPGTVNTAAVIPVAIMSIIYITSIEVDLATLTVPIIAQMIGAYLLPRFVVKMPLKPIRILLAVGMFITVLRIAAEGFGFFPDAGTVSSLSTGKLALLGLLCLVYGGLNNFGLGSYAPTMATVYLMGLNPEAAFPIMMGAAAFSIPVAGIQFVRQGSYSRKVTTITSICGSLGVLVAALFIGNIDFTVIKWLIAAVLVYSASRMFSSAFKDEDDSAANYESHKTSRKKTTISGLTVFCLALILVCAASLIFVFVTNFYSIVSDDVQTRISENNAKIRDNVQGYLREQESFVLSARVGVSYFMSSNPVDFEQLQRYLEETARVRDDVSTLYCTTNEIWNSPGGYAVFSQPWDVPQDWNNTERPWFIAAKNAQGKIAYSKPYVDALTGDIILDISSNVYDENGMDIGVVSEAITIESLNSMLQRSVSIDGQNVFLIDADGIFVVHPDKMMAAKANFFDETGLTEYRDDILLADQFVSTSDGTAVYSLSIPVAGWFVVSIIPTESIYLSAINQIISVFLSPMLIILFMLLAVLISLTFIVRQERRDKILAEHLSEELRSASKSKSDFLATMSHEIRTPMNAIIGIAQIELQKGDLARDYADSMKKIYNSGNGLLGIINDILDMSKIETGKLELVLSEYDMPSLINDAVQLNIVRIGSKPIQFMLDVDEELPSRMIGDELRIKQILNNLLSNAIKYTEKGSIKLTVRHQVLGDDVTLFFTVEDTGQGIKPEDCKRLFSEYSRFNAEANRTAEGTGLGLSITKRLVDMMDGSISVESEWRVGSTFFVEILQEYVPCEAIGRTVSEQLTRFTFKSREERTVISRSIMPYGSVLVVDDVDTNLFVAEGHLTPYKLKTETVNSGFAAIEKVESGNVYDIIFMDHMMPVMDGIETTQKLRAMGYDSTIIALTANALVGNDEMFAQNGFDGFISKPIDIQQLNDVLNQYVRDAHPDEANLYQTQDDSVDGPHAQEWDEKLLSVFRRDAKKAIQTLAETSASGELKLFVTTAHAMKSALANIGESEASAMAYELEKAGQRGDTQYIESNTRTLIDILENLCTKYQPTESASDDNIKEDTEYLNEQLNTIRNACEAYDDSAAYASLDMLKDRQWNRKTADTIEEIRDMLFLHSDFDGVVERISQYFEQEQGAEL